MFPVPTYGALKWPELQTAAAEVAIDCACLRRRQF
jgi:hypothetical protein